MNGKGVAVVAMVLATACHRGAPARHHRLRIEAMAFSSPEGPIAPGDTVTWTNADLVPHTVESVRGTWDSGNVAPGASFTWVATREGLGAYRCAYHPLMRGVLSER